MKSKTTDREVASACPDCGATVVNVQGVSACPRCNWSAR